MRRRDVPGFGFAAGLVLSGVVYLVGFAVYFIVAAVVR